MSVHRIGNRSMCVCIFFVHVFLFKRKIQSSFMMFLDVNDILSEIIFVGIIHLWSIPNSILTVTCNRSETEKILKCCHCKVRRVHYNRSNNRPIFVHNVIDLYI